MEDSEYLPIEFILPEDLPHLKKIVEGGGTLNLVSKPLNAIDHGFMKRMAWRENHVNTVQYKNKNFSYFIHLKWNCF